MILDEQEAMQTAALEMAEPAISSLFFGDDIQRCWKQIIGVRPAVEAAEGHTKTERPSSLPSLAAGLSLGADAVDLRRA